MLDGVLSALANLFVQIVFTAGIVGLCGMFISFCNRCFYDCLGGTAFFIVRLSGIIGTPVHELSHALMCLLFGHRITKVQVFNLKKRARTLGFVEHTYNPKNLWARLGNLFIGIGPIFSGLGVIILMLWLCFRSQCNDYLASSETLVASGADVSEIFKEVFALLTSLPSAFADNTIPAILAMVVILPVSLHVSLSAADVKGSLGAFPIYALLALVFSAITFLAGVAEPITAELHLWGLRLLSLFCLIIAFALVWVAIALLIRIVRTLISIF